VLLQHSVGMPRTTASCADTAFDTQREAEVAKEPNEPGLGPKKDLENAFLSDQPVASNPREGQAKRTGAKTTSPDGKAGHVMTHVCHRVRQDYRQV